MRKRQFQTGRVRRAFAAAMSLVLSAGMLFSGVTAQASGTGTDTNPPFSVSGEITDSHGSPITSVDAGTVFKYEFDVLNLTDTVYENVTYKVTLPDGVFTTDNRTDYTGEYDRLGAHSNQTFSFDVYADGSVSNIPDAPMVSIQDSSGRPVYNGTADGIGTLAVNGVMKEYVGAPVVHVQIDEDSAEPGSTVTARASITAADGYGGWAKLHVGAPDGLEIEEATVDGYSVVTSGNEVSFEMSDLDATERVMQLTLSIPDDADEGSLQLNAWAEYFTGKSHLDGTADVAETRTVSDWLTVTAPSEEPTEEPSEEPSEQPSEDPSEDPDIPGGDVDDDPQTPPDEPADPVIASVSLRRSDSNSNPVEPGDELVFTPSVSLSGSSGAASSGILHFVLPDGFTAADAKNDQGAASSDIHITGSEVTYEIGALSANQSRGMTVTVPVPDNMTDGTYSFQAYFTWDKSQDGSNGTSATSSYQVTVDTDGDVDDPITPPDDPSTVLSDEPDVDVRFGFNGSVLEREFYAGETITYRAVVTVPEGKAKVEDAVLYLVYPYDDVTVVERDIDDGEITHDRDGNEMIKWELGDLSYDSNEGIVRTFALKVNENSDAEEISVYARLVYGNPPEGKDNETESNLLTATRVVPEDGDVTVTMLQNNTSEVIHVDSREYVDYKITVSNIGDKTLTGITLKDVIPDGLEITEVALDAKDEEDYKTSGQTVSINVGKLGPNESRTYVVTVRVPEYDENDEAMSWTNKATVSMYGTKDITSNSVTMQTGNSNVWLEIFQREDSGSDTKDNITVAPGKDIIYTMRLHNDGSGIAEDIVVQQTIPSQLEVNTSSLSSGMSLQNNTVRWNVNDLDPDETASVTFRVHVPDDIFGESTSRGSSTSTAATRSRTARLNTTATMTYVDAAGDNQKGTSNQLTAIISLNGKSDDDSIVSSASNEQAAKKAINESGVSSEALSMTTMNHMLAYQDQDTVIISTVYTKLTPGVTYNAKITLINDIGTIVRDVNGNSCTFDTTFTAPAASGNLPQVTFTVDGKDWVGKQLIGSVAIVNAADAKDTYVSSPADIENRTVYSATVAGIALEPGTVTTSGNGELTGTVRYTNVAKDTNYRVVEVLMDKATGKPIMRADGQAVMGTVDFRAESSEGTVEIPMIFGQEDVEGRDIVTFVTLYNGDGTVVLAVDQDLSSGSYSGTGLANGKGSVYATAQTGEDMGVLPYAIGGSLMLFSAAGIALIILKKRGMI